MRDFNIVELHGSCWPKNDSSDGALANLFSATFCDAVQFFSGVFLGK